MTLRVIDLQGNPHIIEGITTLEEQLSSDINLTLELPYTELNKEIIYDIGESWRIQGVKGSLDTTQYVVKYNNITTKGKRIYQSIKAIPYFFEIFNTRRHYALYDGEYQLFEVLEKLFNGTEFTYRIVDDFDPVYMETFGDGQTKLEILKACIDKWKMEFIINGNQVEFYKHVVRTPNYTLRDDLNASNVTQEIDGMGFYTYAKGFADFTDSEPLNDAGIIVEYEHPLAKVPMIGRKEAPPLKVPDVEDAETVRKALKELVDNSLKISITCDFISLKDYPEANPKIADEILLEATNIDYKKVIRVIGVTTKRNHDGDIINQTVTIGDAPLSERHQANLNFAAQFITELAQGKRMLRPNMLDAASRLATQLLLNARTELEFSVNGIIARSKDNPDEIVLFNSAGLGISTDGGLTFKNAITGAGIVADTITTGTLNANNIQIIGDSEDGGMLYIKDDEIYMEGNYQANYQGQIETNKVKMRMKYGYLRIRNEAKDRSLYYTDRFISTALDAYLDGSASGTLYFFDTSYSTARGVTLESNYGVVALRSNFNRVLLDAQQTINIESKEASIFFRPMSNSRVGNNEFQMAVKNNATASNTDGILAYGSITTGSTYGSGIRFGKDANESTVYATNNNGDIGTGDFYARNLFGGWKTTSDNLYAMVNGTNGGKLRVTDRNGYNDGNPNYQDLQVRDIQADSVRINTATNLYLGCSTNEVRVTNNLMYNDGSPGYKPIRASDFFNMSKAELKRDITEWNTDALSVLTNELQLYQYKYVEDTTESTGLFKHGLVIGDGYKTPSELVFGDGVNIYELVAYCIRAIQQIDEKLKGDVTNATTS